MNLNVIYTGTSSALMTSDIVLVNRKPGILNVNNISDYLLSYDISDIKEGRLRADQSDGFYTYDLNDLKVMPYDLLIYVSTPVQFDGSGLPSNQLEGIGFIELTNIGLANGFTHEIIKIKYNILEAEIFDVRLDLDYSNSEVDSLNYLTETVDSNFRSYSKPKIDSMDFAPSLCSAIESVYKLDSVAPAHKGYLYRNDYYELESLDLRLNYPSTSVVDMKVKPFDGDYWLEVTYANKETIFHNISEKPTSSTTLLSMSLSSPSTTKKYNWQFCYEAKMNQVNMIYKLNPLGNWFITGSDLSTEDKLNPVYREMLLPEVFPGYNLDPQNPSFIYSVSNNRDRWCTNREVRDKLDSFNTVATINTPPIIIWEHSVLKSYKVLETDLQCFVINEYNPNINRNVAYFNDKTTAQLGNNKFRLCGGGEIMVKTPYGFDLYLGSADKKVEIRSIFDLAEVYFSTFDRILATQPQITFENTLIHGGKFYILGTNERLN